MDHGHDISLVLLSIAVSLFGSFTALSLADRIRNAGTVAARRIWTAAAAVAMGGGGIWSMHFVAMLALNLNVPIQYELGLTLLSLALAIVFTGLGLAVVATHGSRPVPLVLAGGAMGLGVVSMHYTGMAAMRMPATIEYDAGLVAASVAIALVASIAALWLAVNLRALWTKLASALIMAAAVCGMHYTGMAAAVYAYCAPAGGSLESVAGLSPVLLAIAVSVATFIVLFLGLTSAIVDQRFAERASQEAKRLRQSESRLYEANARLTREMGEREEAQAALKLAHDELERKIEERTSELQAAKEAAEAASQAKSLFIAGMSHEFRTPLNAVIGYAEMLLEDAEDEGKEDQVRDLNKIRAAGKQLLALINDVLDVSKIESGRMQLQPETFSVAAMVEDTVERCRPLIAKQSNALFVDMALDLGTMFTDLAKLRQSLSSLLSNASKFTENGRIVLQVSRVPGAGGDWLRFSVRDTGRGISAENQNRLFANFSQAVSPFASKHSGAGLGLALSQRLCGLMGGHISVESTLGQGSCFVIDVPASAAPQAAPHEALQSALEAVNA